MKKILFAIFSVCIMLTSCSFSQGYVPSHNEVSTSPIKNSDFVCEPTPSLMSGSSYIEEGITSRFVKIGDTAVLLPNLPTEALEQVLESRLTEFIDSLDVAFVPKYIDFSYNKAFNSENFTFFVNENTLHTSLPSLRFSYNVNTLKETHISDYFTPDELDDIFEDEFLIKNFSKYNKIDLISVSKSGIDVVSGENSYFIESEYLQKAKGIQVFYPDFYEPITDKNEKYVALTFDDGPNPYTTPKILKILEEKNIKATFFMVGYNIEEYPYVVKKVYENKHDIGIHSAKHSNYSMMTPDEIIEDIDYCSDLVHSIIKVRPYLVRPPFGLINIDEIKTDKYFFVNWNVDPLDWKYDDAQQIANEALKQTKSGSIILLHDIYDTTCTATSILIDKLLEEGYRFVTLSEYFDLHGNKTDNKLHFYKEDYNAQKG